MQNWIKAAAIAVSLALPGVVLAQSLESLVNVQGVRENQLVGYSLVVGLDGTGDKNQVKFTNQTITNMLRQFGVQLPNKIDPKVKNVAAVAVSATLPPMYSRGQTIDVTVSSIGDAKSIRGGTFAHPAARRRWRSVRPCAGQRGSGRDERHRGQRFQRDG